MTQAMGNTIQTTADKVECATSDSAPGPSSDTWSCAQFIEPIVELQLSDGRAQCLRLAVGDRNGRPVAGFHAGDSCVFLVEMAIHSSVVNPGLVIELESKGTASNVIYSAPAPVTNDTCRSVASGSILQFCVEILLPQVPADYNFDVELISEAAPPAQGVLRHCRVRAGLDRILVATARDAAADARRSAARPTDHAEEESDDTNRVVERFVTTQLHVTHPAQICKPDRLCTGSSIGQAPTIFHVTHHKAGSQWIQRILAHIFGTRRIPPQRGNYQYLGWPIRAGAVYPTVYLSKEKFDTVHRPEPSYYFVVIRDLRDTVVSRYFSMAKSHIVLTSAMAAERELLQSRDLQEGLLAVITNQAKRIAAIQKSWIESTTRVFRYEDMLADDVGTMDAMLNDQCHANVPLSDIKKAVKACRFERLSGGRSQGDEDTDSHFRKGIAGDWKNYFSGRVKDVFKSQYGELLIQTGYERDLNW